MHDKTRKPREARITHTQGTSALSPAQKKEAVNNQEVPVAASLSQRKLSPAKESGAWQTASPNPDVPVATQWLLAVMPSSISLEEDQYQGRWRILCDSGSCKSLGAGAVCRTRVT